MYIVKNIDGIVKEFDTDQKLLEYTQKVYRENETDQPYPSEVHWEPETVQQAKEYIHEYCDNLTLEEV
jgi:hypothetical protein